MQNADCVIHVFDRALSDDDEIQQTLTQPHAITVINKADLLSEDTPPDGDVDSALYISAKTGAGLDALKQKIMQVLGLQSMDQQPPFSARLRHIEALTRVADAIDMARQQIESDTPLELSAEECRTAQQCLAEITGEFTPDDLLDYVFREFCIGK